MKARLARFQTAFRILALLVFCLLVWRAFSYEQPRRLFHFAIRNGELSKVRQMLVDQPSLIEIQSPSWRTPLHTAAEYGQFEIVKELITRNADLFARCDLSQSGGSGATVLHMAVRNELPDTKVIPIVDELISQGVPVNAKTNHGLTAMDFALLNHKPQVVERLRVAGGQRGTEIP